LVFKRAGLASAASIMNAVILTSVLSAANSGMYASSRMLWSMAEDGYAAKIFAKTNKRGIPVMALIGTTIIGALTFMTSVFGTRIYLFLVAASGLTGFIAWLGIAISHYRFRRAFKVQGHQLSELKYHARWFPFGPIFAFLLCVIVIIGQDIQAFAHFDWTAIGISYMSIPLFIILYSYYKIRYKTKVIPLEKVDLSKHR
jgi:lysine-specific permease